LELAYTDEAISGATRVGRPAIQRLMAAAARHPRPFDVVLVDDSSRIARDLPDAPRFLELMKFVDLQAIFISQDIDSRHEQADTMVAIHGIVDSLYLKELGKKTKRGLAGQFSRGYATGGRTFGCESVSDCALSGKIGADGKPKPVGRHRVVVPDEAAVVVHIYEAYAAGKGVGRIVEELSRPDVPGSRGKQWRYSAASRILRNERYRGVLIWGQRTVERRPDTRRKASRS
jgi:DNA invertase Pin-like site-specific DNA recombinase